MVVETKKHRIGIVSDTDIVNAVYLHHLLEQPFFKIMKDAGTLETRLGILDDNTHENLMVMEGIDTRTSMYLKEQEITIDNLPQFAKADEDFFSELDSFVYFGSLDKLPDSAKEKLLRAYPFPNGGYPGYPLMPYSPEELSLIKTYAETDASALRSRFVSTGLTQYQILIVDKHGRGRAPLATAIWEYLEDQDTKDDLFTVKCAALENIDFSEIEKKYDGRPFEMVKRLVSWLQLNIDSSAYESKGVVTELMYDMADAVFFLEDPGEELIKKLRSQSKHVENFNIEDPYIPGEDNNDDAMWSRINKAYMEIFPKLAGIYDKYKQFAIEKPIMPIKV